MDRADLGGGGGTHGGHPVNATSVRLRWAATRAYSCLSSNLFVEACACYRRALTLHSIQYRSEVEISSLRCF